MKNYKKILFLSFFCLLLTACQSRQVVKTTESRTNEAVEHVTSYSDTLLYTPKSETSLQLPFFDLGKCPDGDFKTGLSTAETPKIFTQKNGNAKATVRIMHDTLTVTAQCDSIALAAKIKKEYFSRNLENTALSNQSETGRTPIFTLAVIFLAIGFIAGFTVKSLINKSL